VKKDVQWPATVWLEFVLIW